MTTSTCSIKDITPATSTTEGGMPAAIREGLTGARAAARQLARMTPETSAKVLNRVAERALEATDAILAANRQDLARMDPENPKYDRLLLDPERLAAIAADLTRVAQLPCPVGEVLEEKTLDNGLALTKVRVPVGVIAVIYESRPNVTFDVFALSLRSGNACVLKGSSDARDSNAVIVGLIHEVLAEFGLPAGACYLAPPEREMLGPILEASDYIDLAIPRGSKGLIDFVRDHARVPVIETGAGIVHTYVDASADFDQAKKIITNAKSRRVSVCNALDTLVLHRDWLPQLPELLSDLGETHTTEVYADDAAFAVLEGHYAAALHHAAPEHFGQEFLSMRMSVKVVDGLDEALDHIHAHSSKHSEAIVATDPAVIERFLNEVDAATVYANASTAFTDGGQFGMGAEIGISTQKLHARGPMALPELTSYKWVVRGDGQTRD
ncbi:glutamate-5-semialdehyde dehydrogenase [Marinihelvus fidelis]|uniref:Gamma-glutamyl phosphate reductase n=1 Tax=Marinihelvus fidelis TaxID=2613842 RepID=A0A5N0TEQ1_9GAMM|nr:glutamate-5-semialdehyde dehydrogenase [Marinihelvus fidelis]KAA9133512.1 glutamate-5-semialdehyde dehydrogenase [Marinihelvus fidelis]